MSSNRGEMLLYRTLFQQALTVSRLQSYPTPGGSNPSPCDRTPVSPAVLGSASGIFPMGNSSRKALNHLNEVMRRSLGHRRQGLFFMDSLRKCRRAGHGSGSYQCFPTSLFSHTAPPSQSLLLWHAQGEQGPSAPSMLPIQGKSRG